MTSEPGVCLNKMLPLSRRLLAGSEHRDLPPPLIPLLSPATNQVCQTTFSLSQEKMAARWARRKKRKMNKVLRKGSHSSSAPTELEHLCFSSPLWMLCKCQRLAFGVWAHRCLWSVYAGEWAAVPAGYWYIVQVNGSGGRYYQPVNAARHWCRPLLPHKKTLTLWSVFWVVFYMYTAAIQWVLPRATYSNCNRRVTSQVVTIMSV